MPPLTLGATARRRPNNVTYVTPRPAAAQHAVPVLRAAQTRPVPSAEEEADAIVAQLLGQTPTAEAALDPETAAWLGAVGQGDTDGGQDAEATAWLRTLGLARAY